MSHLAEIIAISRAVECWEVCICIRVMQTSGILARGNIAKAQDRHHCVWFCSIIGRPQVNIRKIARV